MSFEDRVQEIETFIHSDERFGRVDDLEYSSQKPGGPRMPFVGIPDAFAEKATPDDVERFGKFGKKWPWFVEILKEHLANVNLQRDWVRVDGEVITVMRKLKAPSGVWRLYCG